jgi:hypothetical protein
LLGALCLSVPVFAENEAVKHIKSLIGTAFDDQPETILGLINNIAAASFTPEAMYNKRLIGDRAYSLSGGMSQDLGDTASAIARGESSLFLEILCFKDLFDALSASFAFSHVLLNEISGILGAGTDSIYADTLLGKLKQLKYKMEQEEHGQVVNLINEIHFQILNEIKKSIFAAVGFLSEDFEVFCGLSCNTIMKIKGDSAQKLQFVKEDIIAKICGSGAITEQLDNIFKALVVTRGRDSIAQAIGGIDDFSGFSLQAQLQRLIEDIEDIKEIKEIKDIGDLPTAQFQRLGVLYQNLFGYKNSVQSRIHELYVKITHGFCEIRDVIGQIIDQNNSIFGRINACIKELEIKDILDVIGTPNDQPADQPEETNSLISQIKYAIAGIEEEHQATVLAVLGEEYASSRLFFENIMDAICFIRDSLMTAYPILTRDSIALYRSEFLEKESNIMQLVGEIVAYPTYESVILVCGLKIDSTQKHTLWGCVNSIVRDLSKELKLIINDSVFAPLTNINQQYDNILQEEAAHVLGIIDFLLESMVGINHYKFSCEALVRSLFENTKFPQLPDENANFVDNSAGKAEPGIIEFLNNLLLQDAPNIAGLDINDVVSKLEKFLNTLAMQPLVRILKGTEEDGSPTGLFQILCEVQENMLSAPPDIKAFLKLIGTEADELTLETYQNPTIFGLFNKIIEILSKKVFCLSINSFFPLIKEISDIHDTTTSKKNRMLFPTVSLLLEATRAEDITNNKNVIANIIGNVNDSSNNYYKSLFSRLYSILELIFVDYSDAELSDITRINFDLLGVGGLFRYFYDTLSAQGYKYYYGGELLALLGTPPDVAPDQYPQGTGYFFDLSECLASIVANKSQYKTVENLRKFYAGISELHKKLSVVLAYGPFITPQIFRSNLDATLNEFLLKDLCDGCKSFVSFINSLCSTVNNIQHNLAASPFFADDAFQDGIFAATKEFLESLRAPLNALYEEQSGCIFTRSGILSDMQNKVESFSQKIENIWDERGLQFELVPFATAENTGCSALPICIEELAKIISKIAVSFSAVDIVQNTSNQAHDINEIITSLKDIQQLIAIHPNSCPFCKGFSYDGLIGSIKNMKNELEILQGAKDSFYTARIVQQLHQISYGLKKISDSCPILFHHKQILRLLEDDAFYDMMRLLSDNVVEVAGSIAEISDAISNDYLFSEDTIQNASDINDCIAQIYQCIQDFFQLPGTGGGSAIPILPQNQDNIRQIFGAINSSLSNIFLFWDGFYTAAQETSLFGNGWMLEILGIIDEAVKGITTGLSGLSSSDFFKDDVLVQTINITQSISETITGLCDAFEHACPQRFLSKMNGISQNTAMFSQILQQIPYTLIFDTPDAVELLLLEIFDSIALFFRSERCDDGNKYCPHIVYDKKILELEELTTRLKTALLDFCAANGVVLADFSVEGSNSFYDQVQLIATSISDINGYINGFVDEARTSQRCRKSLILTLQNLADLCPMVRQSLLSSQEFLASTPICLFRDISSEDGGVDLLPFLPIFDDLHASILRIISTQMGSDCFAGVKPLLGEISICIRAVQDSITSLTDLYTAQAFFDNTKQGLILLVADIQNILDFFAAITDEAICVYDVLPLVSAIFDHWLGGNYAISHAASSFAQKFDENNETADDPCSLRAIFEQLKQLTNTIALHDDSYLITADSQLFDSIFNIADLLKVLSLRLVSLSKVIQEYWGNIICAKTLESTDVAEAIDAIGMALDTLSGYIENKAKSTIAKGFWGKCEQRETNVTESLVGTGGGVKDWLPAMITLNNDALKELKMLGARFVPAVRVNYDVNDGIIVKSGLSPAS